MSQQTSAVQETALSASNLLIVNHVMKIPIAAMAQKDGRMTGFENTPGCDTKPALPLP